MIFKYIKLDIYVYKIMQLKNIILHDVEVVAYKLVFAKPCKIAQRNSHKVYAEYSKQHLALSSIKLQVEMFSILF